MGLQKSIICCYMRDRIVVSSASILLLFCSFAGEANLPRFGSALDRLHGSDRSSTNGTEPIRYVLNLIWERSDTTGGRQFDPDRSVATAGDPRSMTTTHSAVDDRIQIGQVIDRRAHDHRADRR